MHIPDVNLLVPRIERVEAAIGILFKKIKIRQIVVNSVRPQISEQADTRLFLSENKATKITDKRLDACTNGNKIKIRTQVVDFSFDESFLQPDVVIETVRSLPHIDVDQPALTRLQEVEIELRCEANAEINGPKAGIAFE